MSTIPRATFKANSFVCGVKLWPDFLFSGSFWPIFCCNSHLTYIRNRPWLKPNILKYIHILKDFWEETWCIFLFVCFRLVASRGSQGLTQWCLKNRSSQWIGAWRPPQRWLVAQMRWESQEKSRRAGMERPAITGKVGLCPAVTFPFGHCRC